MRVAIDISPLRTGHKLRGIGSYTRSLIEALKRIDQENDYILTSKPNSVDADVIHYPYFDFFRLTLPWSKPKPTVVTIHDTIPLVFPHNYPPGFRGKIKFRLQTYSLKSVKAIITDSERSRIDVIKYLRQPPAKVHRVYLGYETGFRKLPESEVADTLKKYRLRQPYILYVGDINYNKNLSGLLTAFAQVNRTHQLVLVSRALSTDIPAARELRAQLNQPGLSGKVTVLINVPMDPRSDLTGLYNGADWYIQPSFYEGFGLPVMEAMACGTPTLVSTGGSLPEITPPGAIVFDPRSTTKMAEAILQALATPTSQKEVIINQAYKFIGQFSWDQTARQTLEIYRQVAAN